MLCNTHIAPLVNVYLDQDPVFLLIKYFTPSTCALFARVQLMLSGC